jgi:hypothetical protein
MNNEVTCHDFSSEEYLSKLLLELSDPVHKRLIQAYQGNNPLQSNPLQSMESELGKILLEILYRED